MIAIRNDIKKVVQSINPLDTLESQHINETVKWIDSGKELFRIKKPDVPDKHLVSYFCLFDQKEQKVLLVEHKKALLWLPPGGHVDPGEHPTKAASRECLEELHIEADFLFKDPIFITSTVTVGLTAGHTDVSLWYVLKGDSSKDLRFDDGEFASVRWFSLDQIPFEKSDPHMKRFISKLKDLY